MWTFINYSLKNTVPAYEQLHHIVVPFPDARPSPDEDTIFFWIKFEILWENCVKVNCESVTNSNGLAAGRPKKQTYIDLEKVNIMHRI